MPDPAPAPPPAPPPKSSWNLRPKDGGAVYTVSDPAALSDALRRGDVVEASAEGVARAKEQGQLERFDDLGSTIRTGVRNLAGGATFGLSDVALGVTGNQYDKEQYQLEDKASPTVAGASRVVGSVAPALLSGGAGAAGAAARALPAGRIAAGAAKIAASGAEGGLVRKVASSAVGGALEGGAQAAGDYISDVALGDRKLSAEGLLGSFGRGAALGGGIGGAAAVTERGLIAAKRLFPAAGTSKAAATQAQRDVAESLDRALSDARSAEDALSAQASAATRARTAVDPAAAARAQQARQAAEVAESAPAAVAAAPRSKTAAALDGAPPRGKGALDDATDLEAAADARRAATATERPIDVFNSPKAKPSGPGGLAKSVDDDLEARFQDALSSYEKREAGEAVAKTRKPRGKTAEVLEGAPPAKKRASRKKAAAAAPPDDLEAQLLASLDSSADDAARASKGAVSSPVAAMDDLEAQLLASLSGVRRADDGIGARLQRVESAVDDAVGDEVSRSARAAAAELRAARRELELAVSAQPSRAAAQIEVPKVSTPTLARAAGADALEGGDAVAAMMTALRKGTPDAVDDVARVVPAIQRFEAAELRAAEALGDLAPAGLRDRVAKQADVAAAHREKTMLADMQGAEQIGRAKAGDIAEAMARAGKPAADAATNIAYPARSGLGVLDGAAGGKGSGVLDAASALEVLGGLGIPGLPSASSLPVVGPLLGLYLQARAAARVMGRFRGKMPATVEARAAKAASGTRDRINTAVRGLLGSGAKGVRGAMPVAASAAELISRPFFGGKPREEKDPIKAWETTAKEIDRLSDPATLRDAVREALPTGDPELADAFEAAAQRKVNYLASKLPRPPVDLSSPFTRLVQDWRPSRVQLMQFARVKRAVDDPASVLEDALGGDLYLEGVDAMRSVYPAQYEQARADLFKFALEHGGEMPRARRVQTSALFDVPMDASLTPTFVAAMQANYDPPAPAQPPASMAPQPPTPSLTRPVKFAERAALPGEMPR